MNEPLLRKNGAEAGAGIAEDEDGRWRASIKFFDLAAGREQVGGPEFFATQARARQWLISRAAFHGFGEADFDIQIERRSSE